MGIFRRQLRSGGLCPLDNCNNSERSSKIFIKTNSTSPVDEATYQLSYQRTLSSTIGHQELGNAHFWISVLTECLSCYIYVFIVCSTRISWTGSIIGHEPSLLAMSLSSGITMSLLMLIFRTVHVNPALTVAFLLTGRIPLMRAMIYMFVHCIGSVAAVTSLYSISVKGHAGALGLDNPHDSLDSWQILIVEMMISFVVTLTTYATCNYCSYTSARKFILEQAVGQNSALFFSDLYSTVPTCDNITVMNNNRLSNDLPPTNRPISSATAQLSRQTQRPNAPSKIYPQQAKSNGAGFLTDIYANEEMSSDYDVDYETNRMYTNSQQHPNQQQSNLNSSPVANKVPPIEELMQNECQLLAPNGFSLRVTVGQALVIGLAYTVTSLTGIPASGASLNPARSFGPAFIMNLWDHHWIYWLGPIAGASVAGFFYEFIFNPTRTSSLCYLPKLFRLSAHDMAKVCSKSRLFHQHQQQRSQRKPSPFTTTGNPYPTAPGLFRSQANFHHQQQMPSNVQQSPNSRFIQPTGSVDFISNAALMNHQHPPIATANTLAHIQASPQQFGANSYHQNQNQNHLQQAIQDLDFDRTTSGAIINLIASKQQQSSINFSQQAGKSLHSASSSNGSSSHATNSIHQQDQGKSLHTRFQIDRQQASQNFRPMNQTAANFSTNKPAFSEL